MIVTQYNGNRMGLNEKKKKHHIYYSVEYGRYRSPKKDQISINYSLTDEFMQGLVYPDFHGVQTAVQSVEKKNVP